MPNFLELVDSAATKALKPVTNLALFQNYGKGNNTVWQNVGFMPNGLTQMPYLGNMGGNGSYDWDNLLGDPLNNSVVAAAVNAICVAITEAELVLEQRTDGDNWERVFKHDALRVFDAHPDISESELWQKTESHKNTRGAAFWIVFYNQSQSKPVEVLPWHPSKVRYWGDGDSLIEGYEIQKESGEWVPVPREQIIHFRHSLADNLRDGYTPLWAGKQAIVGASHATIYTTALLLNSAVSSWLITQKKSDAQGAADTVTGTQFTAFVDAMRRKYTGNKAGVGGIDGINLPLEITRMAWSPNEMSVDKLKAEYSTEILSLLGVSRKICDLGEDPTYLNLAEAISDFWERRMKPACNKNADTLNRQLLPLFGLDKADWRYRFDFSNVSGLQESEDAIVNRWKGVFDSGGCDLHTLQTKIKIPNVPEEYKNLWAKPPQPLGAPQQKEQAPAKEEGEEK